MRLNTTVNKHTIPILLLLSVLAFFVNGLLPAKKMQLHPRQGNQNNLYGYIDPQTGQSSQWLNQNEHEWVCTFAVEHPYGCGSNISWGLEAGTGIDLSNFDTLELQIKYSGNSQQIGIAMRNHNPAYSHASQHDSGKHMSVLINPNEINNNLITIKLNEFGVSSWWITERNIHRRWFSPEFDNVTMIGVEISSPSINKVKLDRITAIGSWIENQTLLLIIVMSWLIFLLTQGAVQFYVVYINSQHGRHQIRELLKKQEDLETEKQYFDEMAKMDPLTEIYNRSGFISQLELFAPGKTFLKSNLAVLILDLDHFKSINDTHGHDFGDEVLRSFAKEIKNNIRDNDVFARWGGEEFILLCNIEDQTSLRRFAEKLCSITKNIRLESKPEFSFTTSIGISTIHLAEHFDEAFKRADNALYQAKQNGRNRVETANL